jgi:hypothetical protein
MARTTTTRTGARTAEPAREPATGRTPARNPAPSNAPARAPAAPARTSAPPPPRTATRAAAPPPPRTAQRATVPAEPRREPEREPAREEAPAPSRALTRPTTGNAVVTQGFDDNLPAFMQDDVGLGTEDMHQDDLEIPRLKLMQGLSPELREINELRAGMFYHSAADFIFEGPFLAVPLLMDRRYILWRPRDSGGGILARADDSVHWTPADTDFRVTLDKRDGGREVIWRTAKTVKQSGLAEWGSMNPDDPKSPPAATLMYNYLLAFPEYPDMVPAVFTFQRSSIKAARKLNTKIKTIKAPIFGVVYQFSSVEDHNTAGNDYYNVQAQAFGRVTDQTMYEEYRAIHDAYSDKGMNIRDLESAQDEGYGANEGDAGGQPAGTPNY